MAFAKTFNLHILFRSRVLFLALTSIYLGAAVVQDSCSPNPCLNGGICGQISNGFVCTCINGYIGIRCERRSDDCSAVDSIKCINGQCRLETNGIPKCECNGHFGGQYCDKSLDTCKPGLCKEGSCVNTLSGYNCKCPSGSGGKNCQIDQLKISQCLGSCKTNETDRNGGKCWHNGSETINVSWGYSQPLCNTMEDCFDLGAKSYDYIDVQLKPIQMQPNDSLIFKTDADASLYNSQFAPHIIPMETPSTNAFKNCNTTKAVPLGNYSWAGPGELKINASFLHLGTQYFIANVNSLYRCEFGLRLNVTVKENQCFDPQSPGAGVCHGHGRCYTDFNKKAYECLCCEGYTSKYCEDEDPCYVNPCKNSGKCSVVRDNKGKTTFRCSCKQGFFGFDCTQVIDVCENKPCLNTGICVSNGTGFSCQCKDGYYGELCQNTDDKCASNPCQNFGRCINKDDSFTCECRDGYKGTLCEVNNDECATNPCHNGTCIDGINNFQCHCQPGYTGVRCETLQDQCNDIPCKNGKCVRMLSSNQCSCGFGYMGSNCEFDIPLCQNSIFCIEENSLACIDHGNNAACICKDGYSGSNCGVDINDCEKSPCQNGGKCVDKLNGVECICNKGTRGRLCEVVDYRTTAPASTKKTSYPPTTKTKIQITKPLSHEIQIDLQIVTDNCSTLQGSSTLESFARSLTQTIRDACNCILSATVASSGSSMIICNGNENGNFVTKLKVKDKEEEKKIICALSERIKKGYVPTSDKNTFIVGMNSDSSICPGSKDDNGPVTVDKTAIREDTKIGIVLGSVAAVIVIIVVLLMISVKFRNRAIHQSKEGNDAKTFLNLVYQSDLEMTAPKSAWSTPELSPAFRRNSNGLLYSVSNTKRYQESSFSFQNPGGQSSTV